MQKRPTVIILGGGIAGLSAALNLADRGMPVTLIERASTLGGRAAEVGCKAVAGRCQLCGGCLLYDRMAAVSKHEGIQVLTEATVTRVCRESGSLTVRWASPSAPGGSIAADALILATGFDHVDARTKGPYGYGTLPAVTTGEEVEKRLLAEGQGAFDGSGLQRVAFVQCVGSRDEHVGRGYCSQVCCRYALRLARLLKSRLPELEVSIFKMDIQASGRDMTEAWHSAQQEGIRLVAGLPAVIHQSTDNPRRVVFRYDDILGNRLAQEEFDLVILSTGVQPRRDAGDLAGLLGINCDPYGFFASAEDGVSTISPGVFAAGSCQAPRAIAEAAAHGERAAEACYLYLQERGS